MIFKSLKLFVRVIMIVLFLQNASVAQDINFAKIDSLVKQRMIENRIVGLSFGIVKNDQIYYCKGYGFTNVDNLYPVTAATRFITGSITKLFTITAIMQLVEQGKLDLNKKLIQYIPDFKLKDKRFADITLFHLITHSSGLAWDNDMKGTMNDTASLEQFVYSLKDAKLNFSPGQKFSGDTYSNTGYDILGYLVEKITGNSFDKYVETKILNRTEMRKSTFSYKSIPIDQLAMPLKLEGNTKEINRFNLYCEVKDKNPVLKYPELAIVNWENREIDKRPHHPSGWLYSSAQDLANWMRYNLKVFRDSIDQPQQFLKYSTLNEMWSLKKGIENRKTSIGLGWWRYNSIDKGNYVFHVGRIPGYSSTLMIFPGKNIGITILCNGMYADEIVWNSLPFEILKIIEQ